MLTMSQFATKADFEAAVNKESARELLAIHEAVMNPQGVVINDSDNFTTKMVKGFILEALKHPVVAGCEECGQTVIAPLKHTAVARWVLVPCEATQAMKVAARSVRVNLQFGNQGMAGPISPFEAGEIYRAMLDAV